MALTPKQEKFCQCVVSGMSYKDSYITAYDTNCSDRTALTEGSKLALRDDIQKRILSLTKPIQEAAQITGLNARQEQIEFIKKRIAICEQKEDEQSLIRWNEQLNKIYALYKEVEQEEKQDQTVNNLDTNILRKLAN